MYIINSRLTSLLYGTVSSLLCTLVIQGSTHLSYGQVSSHYVQLLSKFTHSNQRIQPQKKEYCIPCECGMVYFGGTGSWFDAKAQQHQTAVKNLDMKNSITAHIKQTGHMIKWGKKRKIY